MPAPSKRIVRPARPADADTVGEIHVVSWQAGYAGQLPGEYPDGLSIADRRRTWRQRLERPMGRRRLLVAEAGREIGGFSFFGPSRDDDASDTAELYSIYLHPRHWRRGLGRALVDHTVDALLTEDYRLVTLWVLTPTTALAVSTNTWAGTSRAGPRPKLSATPWWISTKSATSASFRHPE